MKRNFKKLIPWILFTLVVGGLIAWIFISKRTTQEELLSYDQKLKEANLHYESKEFSTAMSLFYEATDIVPEKVDAYEGIVNILLSKNRVDDAYDIVKKSAKRVNQNDQALLYSLIGDYYYDVKDFNSAKSMYEESLGIGISYPQGQLSYAKTLLQLGKVDDAKNILQREIYEEDLLYEAKLILSYVYSAQDVEKAKSTVKSIVPSDSWKVYYEEIDGILNSLNDDEKFNATKLSRVYINNGYPYLAISLLEPKEESMAEYLEGLYFLGRAYYEYPENQKSINVLDKAISLGGLESDISWIQARAYWELDDLENAIEKYDKAVAYAGENVSKELVTEYVNILLDNNQGLKAEEILKKVINYTEEAWSRILLVEVYYNLENSEKVNYYISSLDDSELEVGDEKELLYWKTIMLIEKDDIEFAKTNAAELLLLDKYNPKYYFLMGRISFVNGNVQDTKDNLEKCIEYDLDYEITESALKLLSRVK